MASLADNVTVVIRAAGERTAASCRHLIARHVAGRNIVTVRERPFEAALAKGLRAGLEGNLRWTLCLDADVLVEKRYRKFRGMGALAAFEE